jgi:hypothetical protein
LKIVYRELGKQKRKLNQINSTLLLFITRENIKIVFWLTNFIVTLENKIFQIGNHSRKRRFEIIFRVLQKFSKALPRFEENC